MQKIGCLTEIKAAHSGWENDPAKRASLKTHLVFYLNSRPTGTKQYRRAERLLAQVNS